MLVADPLLSTLSFLIRQAVWLYTLVIIGAVVVTWVNADPLNPIVRFLRAATEPVFRWVRRVLPFVVIGGLDLSPLVVLLGLQAAQIFLERFLWQLSRGF
ncbi:MAG TPA: YggT family protein [Candidatus Methylomirabilis sp.]|jgi:YggT family protein